MFFPDLSAGKGRTKRLILPNDRELSFTLTSPILAIERGRRLCMTARLSHEHEIYELTAEEARELFEKEAQARLHMSGDEFKQRWQAGELDPEDPNVRMVAMILPLAR
jgi:hypothetical protein